MDELLYKFIWELGGFCYRLEKNTPFKDKEHVKPLRESPRKSVASILSIQLLSFSFFPSPPHPPKQHTAQTYQVPLVRNYHLRNEFAIRSIVALGSDHEFLTFTGLACEQNLRGGGGGNEREKEREQKDEEEKQNKSKAAFLVTPTSQRPSVKGPGL